MLQKEFLVNLADSRYAKVSAALLLNPKDHSAAAAGGHGAPGPAEGYGAMTQEAIVRAIVTDELTGLPADDLEDAQEARQGSARRSSSGSTRRPTCTRTTSCSPTSRCSSHERRDTQSRLRLDVHVGADPQTQPSRSTTSRSRPPSPRATAARERPRGELERLRDVPVELAVEIGRTRMTIGETLALGPGSIITLNRLAGEPVDLLVNGKPIARGEVVVIDEEFGLRVTEVVDGPAPGPQRDAE